MDFPGYNIICEIGRGGMATVFRARQVMLDREVALKVLSPALASDPSNAQRFLQEARMLASLEHPHVVPVYDVGVTPDGSYYFSMQLLENGDLTTRLQRGVGEAELVRVLSAVADALAYAHARGYVHRDVTPTNILFDAEDKPRLTDFGIARAMAMASRITASGLSVGTSHYMSPEQARGGELDPRSDIYSLGVVCYEALTGHTPFRGEDSFAVAYAHVYEPVPPLPPALAKWQPLVDRCMAKNPEDRFQDCAGFIASLRRIVFTGRGADATPHARAMDGKPTVSHTRGGAGESRAASLAAASDTPTAPSARRGAHEDGRDELQAADAPTVPRGKLAGTPGGHVVAAAASTGRSTRHWLGPLLGALGLIAVVVVFALWQGSDWRAGNTTQMRVAESPTNGGETAVVAGVETGAQPDAASGSLAPSDVAPNAEDVTTGSAAALQTVVDPVEALLELARTDIAERRYSSPPERNALDRYQLVQRFEPDNAAAREGIERVVATYLRLADEYAADEDLSLWSGYLQRAEELARQFKVDAVAAGVTQRRQDRLAKVLGEAEAAVVAWDRARAVLLYERAQGLAPDTAAVKQGLARARRIGRDGFVFRDRAEGRPGPEMIVVNRLGFSRAPVTVGEFRRYWEAGGSSRFGAALPSCRDRESVFRSSRRRTFLDPGFAQGEDHPVVCISAAMADDYARWLARVSGKAYRLASSAELRAAGVGAARDCQSGNIRDVAFRGVYGGRGDIASCNDGHATTAPIAAFKLAGNGLRDAVGNVREWSADCVGSNCGERRVVGASWASSVGDEPVRTFPADTGFNTIGFRVVRTIP